MIIILLGMPFVMLVFYCRDFNRVMLGFAFRYYILWLLIPIFTYHYSYIQVSQLGAVAQKYQSFTQNATSNISVPELQNNCNM